MKRIFVIALFIFGCSGGVTTKISDVPDYERWDSGPYTAQVTMIDHCSGEITDMGEVMVHIHQYRSTVNFEGVLGYAYATDQIDFDSEPQTKVIARSKTNGQWISWSTIDYSGWLQGRSAAIRVDAKLYHRGRLILVRDRTFMFNAINPLEPTDLAPLRFLVL